MTTTTSDHKKSAMQSLHHLRLLAYGQGDLEAIIALRDIGLKAASILGNLTGFSDTATTSKVLQAGAAIAKQVAKESLEWPVAYHAISEKRKEDISRTDKLNVGSALGIRLSGKARTFDYNTQTGFALDIFDQIEKSRLNPASHFHTASQAKSTWENLAAELPPLSINSHPLWVAAGVELCRDNCQDDWKNFPWPECVILKAEIRKDRDGGLRKMEHIVKDVILKGLKILIP